MSSLGGVHSISDDGQKRAFTLPSDLPIILYREGAKVALPVRRRLLYDLFIC